LIDDEFTEELTFTLDGDALRESEELEILGELISVPPVDIGEEEEMLGNDELPVAEELA